MITPCSKHILCPPGSGTDTPDNNYSSEHVDIPNYRTIAYPTTPYGTYTACLGRCISLVSQQEADLCAQRQAFLCTNQTPPGGDSGGGGGPPTFGNTVQMCTEPNTGRTVIVPPNVFIADSQEQANADALAYANKLQVDGNTPPGVTTVPSDGNAPGPGGSPNPIPVPTPQNKPKPKPPPAESHCKPCDDTVGVDTFTVAADLPVGTLYQQWDSAPLKCGIWKFEVTGGPFDPTSPPSFVSMGLAAADPSRTPISWSGFFDCPQPAWVCPCGSGETCDPQTTQKFGVFPGCCDQTSVTCKYAGCATLEDGTNWLMIAQIFYTCPFASETTPAKNFTIKGTWLGPVPGA